MFSIRLVHGMQIYIAVDEAIFKLMLPKLLWKRFKEQQRWSKFKLRLGQRKLAEGFVNAAKNGRGPPRVLCGRAGNLLQPRLTRSAYEPSEAGSEARQALQGEHVVMDASSVFLRGRAIGEYHAPRMSM